MRKLPRPLWTGAKIQNSAEPRNRIHPWTLWGRPIFRHEDQVLNECTAWHIPRVEVKQGRVGPAQGHLGLQWQLAFP